MKWIELVWQYTDFNGNIIGVYEDGSSQIIGKDDHAT